MRMLRRTMAANLEDVAIARRRSMAAVRLLQYFAEARPRLRRAVDWHMPKSMALSLAPLARQRHDVPVIFLTGTISDL